MKTNKRLLVFAIAMALTATASAQLYVNIGAGYGLAANRELLTFESNSDSAGGVDKGVYGSLGAGVMPHLAIGYQANDHVAVEFGFDYLLGKKYTGTNHQSTFPSGTFDSESEIFARSIRISPQIRFGVGEGPMIWYMRTGLVLGLGNKITWDATTTDTDASGTTKTHQVVEYDGGLAIGYTGSCGFTYMFSDMMGIYVEGFFISQEWAPKHSVYTTYEVDGQDQTGNMTIHDRETDYVDELTYTNSPPNDSQPDQDLKWYYPMSSAGFAIGIHIHLGGE